PSISCCVLYRVPAVHSRLPQPDAAHPALHSFPTRRSSDLRLADVWDPALDVVLKSRRVCELKWLAASGQLPYPDAASHFSSHTTSEEHTSELQSRGHIVCRLLFEKKNA